MNRSAAPETLALHWETTLAQGLPLDLRDLTFLDTLSELFSLFKLSVRVPSLWGCQLRWLTSYCTAKAVV
jgi:hypothetical protein